MRGPQDAAEAFARLDSFMSASPLTLLIAGLETQLAGASREAVEAANQATGLTPELLQSALTVRERIGNVSSLIHAAVITNALPRILEPDEAIIGRPSLGAGNDTTRVFDLETNLRVAEFKVSGWRGADGMRQRGLFADAVGLAMDTSGRRRELYVVGELPIAWLTRSNANAVRKLSKSALRLREAGLLTDTSTVSQFIAEQNIRIVDLREVMPEVFGSDGPAY